MTRSITETTPGTPNGTTLALLQAAGLCWSAPAAAALVRRGTPVPAGQQLLGEFLVIPSAARPRLLVPAGVPAAAAESVRRFSQALSWPERAARTMLSAGLRTGALDAVVPDRLRVVVDADRAGAVESLPAEVGRLLGEPVVLSLGVGTPRANRKPVLQAITRSGRALGFVKLGDTPLTRGLLAAEAHALTRLADARPRVLQVPELLHLGRWNGIDLLIQSALRTPPVRTHGIARIPYPAMRALVSAFDGGYGPVAASAGWAALTSAPEAILDPARRELFADLVAAAGGVLADRDLRHGAWHGDFTPWNIAWAGAAVRIWDWERFAEGVPAGLDPLHYALAALNDSLPWPAALAQLRRDAAEVLAPIGVRTRDADAVHLFYLLDLARRYVLSAQPEAGRPLRGKTDELLAHLAGLLLAHPGTAPADLPDWSTP